MKKRSWSFYKVKYAKGLVRAVICMLFVSYAILGVVAVSLFAGAGVEGVCMGSLVGVYAGAGAFSGQVSSPVSRLAFHIDGAAEADVDGILVTVTQSTKRKTGTLIPGITVAVLREISGFIHGVGLKDTTLFTSDFSIPISIGGGAYDLEGGSLTVSIANQIAACTTTIWAIDDEKRSNTYIEVVPIACDAGGVKQIDLMGGIAIFLGGTNITRLKLIYPERNSVEYVQGECQAIARVVNPVHTYEGSTVAPLLTVGYNAWLGINAVDAVACEVTLTAAGFVYVVKHIAA